MEKSQRQKQRQYKIFLIKNILLQYFINVLQQELFKWAKQTAKL
jgi:hypothetical protein